MTEAKLATEDIALPKSKVAPADIALTKFLF